MNILKKTMYILRNDAIIAVSICLVLLAVFSISFFYAIFCLAASTEKGIFFGLVDQFCRHTLNPTMFWLVILFVFFAVNIHAKHIIENVPQEKFSFLPHIIIALPAMLASIMIFLVDRDTFFTLSAKINRIYYPTIIFTATVIFQAILAGIFDRKR